MNTTIFVIGANGDLAARLLYPALLRLEAGVLKHEYAMDFPTPSCH